MKKLSYENSRLTDILDSLKNMQADGDPEVCHIDADTLIQEAVSLLGRPDIANAHKEAGNRVGFCYS